MILKPNWMYRVFILGSEDVKKLEIKGNLIFEQFEVIDLAKIMKPLWNGPGKYPGYPYKHNRFRRYFSDHRLIVFRMNIPDEDDD